MEKYFSQLSREICLFLHCLVMLLVPKERMLRPLVEVSLEQIVQNQSRLPVELFAFFSEHKQKQTLDINLRVMVNVSDERTNAVIV